jgi:hypothetical protein
LALVAGSADADRRRMTAAQPPQDTGRTTTRLITMGVLVGVALVIWAVVELAPRPHRAPAIIAVFVVLIGALGAWAGEGWWWRVAVVLLAVAVAAGIWMLFFASTAVGGLLVFAGVLVTVSTAAAVDDRKPGTAGPGVTLLLTVLFVACVLAALGFLQRQGYQYAADHGARVAVTLPGSCVETIGIRRSNAAYTTCENATWSVGGTTVRGTLHAGLGELRSSEVPFSLTDEQVAAYAVGDDAYTGEYGEPSRFYPLHVVPFWLLFPFPALLAVRWLARGVAAQPGGAHL